ncbi:hypothetical protein FOA52_005409 [Chlamydomonas sp. UWO 241]|nr:hypothetical protein FOA52_005409 [Chlamydomonas sp. UWO 241]
MAGLQTCASVASHLLLSAVLEAQATFGPGFHMDAVLRTELAIVAATEVAALLLLLLLTPKAAPAGAGGGKAATDGQATQPTAAPTNAAPSGADARAHAPVNNAATDPSVAPAAATDSRANTATARAAVPPVAPTTSTPDGAGLQYTSVLMSQSVPFTAKFPSLHLADHPRLATPEGLAVLRARAERKVSERASALAGAPVSLRFVTLNVGAGCVVVHGKMIVDGSEGGEAEAEMLQAVLTSELLGELMPEGAHVLDGDAAVLQLGGGGGAAPMELAFVTAGGRFTKAPPRSAPTPLPGVPLLSVTCALLAVPAGGSSSVHLQFATALLALALGNDPELVVTWVPSGASAPRTPLVRASVAALQAAARARGNPPGLIDIDVDLGPRPSHGMFIAQLVDGDALLAADSVALLPASTVPVVAELLRARIPADALHAVAHDLGVLLCGPSVRSAGDAAVLRRIVLALMAAESASRPALPALRALLDGCLRELDGSLRELDAGETVLEASPSSSSPVGTTADAAADCPPYNRPPPLWCRVVFIVCAIKLAGFLMEGERVAALSMALLCVPYGLEILADNTRVFSSLPHVLRGLDACAAGRIYRVLLCIAAVASGINPIPKAPHHLKYGGDIGLLLAWSWFERPRSPTLGAAFALFVELPSAMLADFREVLRDYRATQRRLQELSALPPPATLPSSSGIASASSKGSSNSKSATITTSGATASTAGEVASLLHRFEELRRRLSYESPRLHTRVALAQQGRSEDGRQRKSAGSGAPGSSARSCNGDDGARVSATGTYLRAKAYKGARARVGGAASSSGSGSAGDGWMARLGFADMVRDGDAATPAAAAAVSQVPRAPGATVGSAPGGGVSGVYAGLHEAASQAPATNDAAAAQAPLTPAAAVAAAALGRSQRAASSGRVEPDAGATGSARLKAAALAAAAYRRTKSSDAPAPATSASSADAGADGEAPTTDTEVGEGEVVTAIFDVYAGRRSRSSPDADFLMVSPL